MSNEGEKTCPLCAEEMDLTDQQLKPCKCGYEICIWCWHHIMDMAEKDDSEGRCPACRTPYDKEKIVGMAAKCERLVAEMSMEKKLKSQKGKSKTSEGRKHLSSVRVIQRNLVYIVGLPLNLADEDVLQRKEYFSQYGKVQKVSISRTAAGTIQHFANNTCSVYITYSKEEEALRCIQAVHNFVLDGRQLRACFGTTKYCHAWLRNMPCSNPDCLYLHEVGSEEATFIKDDSVSSYMRNKVQQITGATCDTQRRSGTFLPPPADDYSNNCSSSWGKPVSKNPTNQNPPSTARVSPPKSSAGPRVSPPNSSSGRSVALPAAASWGTRSSNNQPLAASVVSSNGPSTQRIDSCDGSLSLETAVVSHVSHGGDIIKKPNEETDAFEHKGKLEQVDIVKEYIGVDQGITVSEKPVTTGLPTSSDINSQICAASSRDTNKSSHVLSMSNNRHHRLYPVDAVKLTQTSAFFEPENALRPTKDLSVPRERPDFVSDLPSKVAGVRIGEPEVDILPYQDRRLRDSEIVTNRDYTHNLPPPSNISSDRKGYSPEQAYVSLDSYTDPPLVGQNLEKISDLHAYSTPVIPNGYSMNLVSSSCLDSSIANSSSYTPEVGRFEGESANVDRNSALTMGESSIISNILSMDFDPWDDSLTSPQNLAKLLGETDKQQGPLRISNSWKSHNNNQSRFSFAREEECTDQGSNLGSSVSDITLGLKYQSLTRDSSRSIYGDNLRNENGFSSFSFEGSDNFVNNHSPIASHKISVTRAQLSAPPGFSGPTRAPPPGFTSHERMERTFDNFYGNHMFDTSSLLRESHQALSPVNIGGAGDIELADPAILAVGGRVPGGINSPGLDMRSNFPAQWNSFETDARINLLSQSPFSPQQTQRYLELGENFPSRTNAYGISSRIAEQALANNLSLYSQSTLPQSRSAMMSNGHWDGWNEVQSGNDMAMADLLRTERLGLNKFYSTGYEDTKFGLPNSGDLYNRTFGI